MNRRFCALARPVYFAPAIGLTTWFMSDNQPASAPPAAAVRLTKMFAFVVVPTFPRSAGLPPLTVSVSSVALSSTWMTMAFCPFQVAPLPVVA